MSETTTHGNRRRRRGGRSRSPQGQNQGPRLGSTPRAGKQKPTGFQKFLSLISFGLLGKPKTLPRPASTPAKTGLRTESSRPPREPKPRRDAAPGNPSEVSTERLYVGNLSYDATESDLFELFSGVGSVRNSEIVVNNRTQRSKGFAFVTMGTVDEARRAVLELGGKEFMGRPLQISGAKPLGSSEDRAMREETPSSED